MDESHIYVTADGWLRLGALNIRCALGKGGVTDDKCEGDEKTPLGCFALREAFIRTDRLPNAACALPTTPITQDMGWCDDPLHHAYNQRVTLPFAASHEQLWREDHRYDIIITLGYNDAPPVAGKGSAIFFHIAEPDYAGTQGCVAIAQEDMLRLLPLLHPDMTMTIAQTRTPA